MTGGKRPHSQWHLLERAADMGDRLSPVLIDEQQDLGGSIPVQSHWKIDQDREAWEGGNGSKESRWLEKMGKVGDRGAKNMHRFKYNQRMHQSNPAATLSAIVTPSPHSCAKKWYTWWPLRLVSVWMHTTWTKPGEPWRFAETMKGEVLHPHKHSYETEAESWRMIQLAAVTRSKMCTSNLCSAEGTGSGESKKVFDRLRSCDVLVCRIREFI